jgi:hypothetical protein
MKYWVGVILFAMVLPANAADHRPCKSNPEIIAACFHIHGRVTPADGTPNLRIWEVGTKHYLGVTAHAHADDADAPIIPDNLERMLTPESELYGDFEVCPFTKRQAGEMQMVCIQSASHLVRKNLNSK